MHVFIWSIQERMSVTVIETRVITKWIRIVR